MRAFKLLLALLAGLVIAGPAQAHTRSESHSNWTVTDNLVRLVFTMPDLEAKRLDPAHDRPSDATLGQYIAAHTGVTDGANACPPAGLPRAVGAAPGYRRFERLFRCADASAIVVESTAFFELVPTHVNFAQVQTGSGKFIEQLITTDERSLSISGGHTGDLENASFLRYVVMGIAHIYTGVDHQLFLLALLLLSARPRDVAFVITGFTLGHSITLALAVTGVFRPHTEYIDALIGLTIALVAADNIMAASHRPLAVASASGLLLLGMAGLALAGVGAMPPLLLAGAALFAFCYLMMSGHVRNAAPLRLIVTLVFGLIHGFGFAADLIEMSLPPKRLIELLVGFNLGVEIGQLSLVAFVLAIVAGLARYRLTLPRVLVVDVTAAFLAGMGLFWFATRSYV